jgi:hypothetical protein
VGRDQRRGGAGVSRPTPNSAMFALGTRCACAATEPSGRPRLLGANPAGGSGLIGLRDRVQALGGSITVNSRLWDGTAVVVELPLQLN